MAGDLIRRELEFLTEAKGQEALVAQMLKWQKGGTIRPADARTDIKRHIDFWWRPEGTDLELGIDVKGRREGAEPNAAWCELRNVNGEKGSLFGDATYLAFIFTDCIAFANREDLCAYVEQSVSGVKPVGEKPEECLVPYQRDGREDLIVKVRKRDILHHSGLILTINQMQI